MLTSSPLDSTEIVLAIAVIAYLIILSYAASKFHKHLSNIKLAKLEVKLESMLETDAEQVIKDEVRAILKLRGNSYLLLLGLAVVHLVISLVIGSNLLVVGIPYLLSNFILFVNYWLKGSGVVGHLRFRRSFLGSPYE